MADSNMDSTPETKSQSGKPSTIRLVIRADITREPPALSAVPERSHRRIAALLVAAVAAVALTWVGISVFKSAPKEIQTPSPQPAPAASEAVPVSPAEPSSAAAKAVTGTEVTLPIGTVLPNPSHSALQTIRGTVRVAVRVTIDPQGSVITATLAEPGPSRYFRRLSVDAARKWTFTPSTSEVQRTMLLRFDFTRAGATARADR
ncbi:TonB family protein [Povalibacter sp.]|uniref:TonB family protein n=1 Tax=Povalibacter sp. TaxID=1962978 RepID=UPI002F400BCA